MHGRDAMSFEFQFKSEIEVRRIDADKKVGRMGKKTPLQPTADADDLKKMLDHLDIAAHREFLKRKPYLHPRGLHTRPAYPGKMQFRHQLAHRADQLAAQQVARCFASDYAYGAVRLMLNE